MTILTPSGSKLLKSKTVLNYNIKPHRYARLYLAIQFFDPDSLLPPPFTFLTLIMYLIRAVAKSNCMASQRSTNSNKRYKQCAAIDIEYRSLIFSFIDNVKPEPESPKGKNITPVFDISQY
jgi:hypothetical protein